MFASSKQIKAMLNEFIKAAQAADKGKVLKIVNGVPTWVTP